MKFFNFKFWVGIVFFCWIATCEVENYQSWVYILIQTVLWIHVVMTFYNKASCDSGSCPFFSKLHNNFMPWKIKKSNEPKLQQEVEEYKSTKVANSPKARRKFLLPLHQTPFLNVEFVIPRNHYIHSNKEGWIHKRVVHSCSKGSIQDWYLQMTEDSKNSDCKCPLAFKKTQFFILKNTFSLKTSLKKTNFKQLPLKVLFKRKSHLVCEKKL